MWPDRVSNPGPLALESDALKCRLLQFFVGALRVNTVTLSDMSDSYSTKIILKNRCFSLLGRVIFYA